MHLKNNYSDTKVKTFINIIGNNWKALRKQQKVRLYWLKLNEPNIINVVLVKRFRVYILLGLKEHLCYWSNKINRVEDST